MIPPLDLLIAVVLIVGPGEIPAEPPCTLDSLRAAALGLELLDARECGYYFVRQCEFKSDLCGMRQRFEDLRDAPPVDDCSRFPSRDECGEQKRFNREYRSWLEERQRLYPNDAWIAEALEECAELYRVWDWAQDAQCFYYVSWRRRCLRNIREAIGPHRYYAGCLPASVPMWPFRVID